MAAALQQQGARSGQLAGSAALAAATTDEALIFNPMRAQRGGESGYRGGIAGGEGGEEGAAGGGRDARRLFASLSPYAQVQRRGRDPARLRAAPAAQAPPPQQQPQQQQPQQQLLHQLQLQAQALQMQQAQQQQALSALDTSARSQAARAANEAAIARLMTPPPASGAAASLESADAGHQPARQQTNALEVAVASATVHAALRTIAQFRRLQPDGMPPPPPPPQAPPPLPPPPPAGGGGAASAAPTLQSRAGAFPAFLQR